MDTYAPLIAEFLRQPALAVIGISSSKQTVANGVCAKLRSGDRTVYAVGRHSSTFLNEPCYPDLASLPAPVQGVFAAARPENIELIVEECIALKIPRVWVHNFGGTTSTPSSVVTPVIVQRCRDNGIALIPGACPMMYCEDADFGHRCIKWFLSVSGRLQ